MNMRDTALTHIHVPSALHLKESQMPRAIECPFHAAKAKLRSASSLYNVQSSLSVAGAILISASTVIATK